MGGPDYRMDKRELLEEQRKNTKKLIESLEKVYAQLERSSKINLLLSSAIVFFAGSQVSLQFYEMGHPEAYLIIFGSTLFIVVLMLHKYG